VSLQDVREKVDEVVGISDTTPIEGSPPFTPRAKKVLELSLREALQLGHNYIGTEHILLGIVHEGEGVAALVLTSLGADPPKVRQQVIQLLSGYQGSVSHPTSISRNIVRRRPLDAQQGTFTERVGKEWSVRVVRAGRAPSVYEAAYRELEDLLESVGIAIDGSGVSGAVVSSVETNEGPGLALSTSHWVEDEREVDADDGGQPEQL
jgi:ATP-dependent Clp protease ATP-binding subunit ClpA